MLTGAIASILPCTPSWPLSPCPHAHRMPWRVSAREWRQPAATVLTPVSSSPSEERSTARGRNSSASRPCPRALSPPKPQEKTHAALDALASAAVNVRCERPLASAASRLWKPRSTAARLWNAPADTSSTRRPARAPNTTLGCVACSPRVPWPSCPKRFEPHDQIWPRLLKASTCSAPTATRSMAQALRLG